MEERRVQTQEVGGGATELVLKLNEMRDCDVIGHIFAGSTKMNQEIETQNKVQGN